MFKFSKPIDLNITLQSLTKFNKNIWVPNSLIEAAIYNFVILYLLGLPAAEISFIFYACCHVMSIKVTISYIFNL